MKINIKLICDIAHEAGNAIMTIYNRGKCNVELKDDQSPLTYADKASHDVIEAGLKRHFPDIPILSEEGKDIPYEVRKDWQRFWLVDPLDGTKEFINRNGEFTVNIALVEQGRAVIGVVYVPALQKLYWGAKGEGAGTQVDDGDWRAIKVRQPDHDAGLTMVVSRSHPPPEIGHCLKSIKIAATISIGSSLKFCIIAEGKADLYPRYGTTMEWDTAAGHAIVETAGGCVLSEDGKPLVYNKASLFNPYFVVTGQQHLTYDLMGC